MSETKDSQHAFYLLNSLIRSLAHQIRTPLSVISNDLYFFKTQTKSDDFDRSIEKCRKISELFSKLDSWNRTDTHQLTVDLTSIIKNSFQASSKQETQSANFNVENQDLIEFAFKELAKICNQIFYNDLSAPPILSLSNKEINLDFKFKTKAEWLTNLPVDLTLFTHLINYHLARDLCEVSLIDAALLACSVRSTIKASAEKLSFIFSMNNFLTPTLGC